MKMFDSHAHYYDEKFGGSADGILKKLFADNVGTIVNVGTNNENSLVCIAQAKKYENMYDAVGIHPSDCEVCTDIDAEMAKLEELLDNNKENKTVAIGEIGLDFHYDGADRDKQREYFIRQMKIAEKRGMPVIIHDRDAHGSSMDIVDMFPNVKGVFHSFSGSPEMAHELVSKGWYVSFSGVVTFKNAAKTKRSAAAVPLDRIMVETDCPYLAPHPYRGELNHSGLMSLTIEELARIQGISDEEMTLITAENASKLFGIPIVQDDFGWLC